MVVAHWAGYHYIITSKTPRCWWKYCNDFDSIFYIQVLSSLHHLPNLAKMPKILTVDLAHEEQCGTGAGNDGKAADLVLYQALDMEGGEVAFPWYNFYVRVYLFRLYAVSDSGLLRVWLRFWLCLWLWFKLVLNGVVIGRLAVVVTGDLFIEKTVVLTTVVFCATAVVVWICISSQPAIPPYRHTSSDPPRRPVRSFELQGHFLVFTGRAIQHFTCAVRDIPPGPISGGENPKTQSHRSKVRKASTASDQAEM